MRLPRLRITSWKLLIPFLIAADLFVLWVWAARPPRIYQDWLGLGDVADEAPIRRLAAWVAWKDGPRTPSGCISLFTIGELFFAGVLLIALVPLLAIPLAAWWSGGSSWRPMSTPLRLAGAAALRFRVRTTFVAIAILGLYLSWEVHAWRTWRLRISYMRRSVQEGMGESGDIARLEVMRSLLDDLSTGPLNRNEYSRAERSGFNTKASYVWEGFATRDRLDREISYLSARIPARTALRQKYERAAANPSIALDPDAPFPEREPETNVWSARDPARALATYDELARVYPDLVEARSSSAWIRATCPDARFRDGKLAVASATRACELTNWQDSTALGTLAAAFAEAGDFEVAVKWQQKAVALAVQPRRAQLGQERLALYLERKPYRQK